MAWKLWLRGLIAAALGGVGTALTVMLVDPQTFNLTTGLGLVKLGQVVGVSALIAMGVYLKKHPNPWEPEA